MNNMKAKLIKQQSIALEEGSTVHIKIWRVPQAVRGSAHDFKYSLALVVDDACVLRYDNEAGKGDHKHVGAGEVAYAFSTPEQLIEDFFTDVENWRG